LRQDLTFIQKHADFFSFHPIFINCGLGSKPDRLRGITVDLGFRKDDLRLVFAADVGRTVHSEDLLLRVVAAAVLSQHLPHVS
jgi:hypothetical protein